MCQEWHYSFLSEESRGLIKYFLPLRKNQSSPFLLIMMPDFFMSARMFTNANWENNTPSRKAINVKGLFISTLLPRLENLRSTSDIQQLGFIIWRVTAKRVQGHKSPIWDIMIWNEIYYYHCFFCSKYCIVIYLMYPLPKYYTEK